MVLRQHLLLWKCSYHCELNKQQFILIGGGALAREGLSAPPSGIRPPTTFAHVPAKRPGGACPGDYGKRIKNS